MCKWDDDCDIVGDHMGKCVYKTQPKIEPAIATEESISSGFIAIDDDVQECGFKISAFENCWLVAGHSGWHEASPKEKPKDDDRVNHPKHYTAHPSDIECITVTEHMGFNIGNAVTHLWRADEKGNALEDLKKAAWYVNREIEKRTRT